jgi:hypothetical protein
VSAPRIAAEQERPQMTKARTVGGKRRGRPRKDGPRVPGSNRLSRVAHETREEAQRAAAQARCRLMGWPDTPENRKRALADHMGCTAGRAIDGHPDRADLWAAIKLVAATYARYWRAIGAPPPYAKAARLTYLPDILGSDGVEASRWDDRSEEERVRAATAAMMRVEQALGMVGAAAEVKGVVLADEPVRDFARFVAGLRRVST